MADARYISDRVKKQLYALSGNECANPLCNNKLVFPDDNAKDDQICHIEAASPDGPRYNPNQTDDERRGFDNLILLCHKCHDMIDNNPDKYPVELLKKWKREHEAKYQHNYKAKTFSFSVPDGLLPRDKEADNLFDKIITNRIFNLVGIGGSGKSSLAYLMMQKHENDFNEIAYVVVNNKINIKDTIVSQLNEYLKLDLKEDDIYKQLITYLENNFKSIKPNLLVLDINELSDETKDFAKNIHKICPNSWKILILSREYIDPSENIPKEDLNQKQDPEFLKKLFLKRAENRYADFDSFEDLFATVFHNPLLTEQLGFYLSKLPEKKSLEEIKAILFGNKFKNKDLKGLAILTNDNRSTLIEFLTNLISYNSDSLDLNEKALLRHFILWPVDFINYKVIQKLLRGVLESDDVLDETLGKLTERALLTTQTLEDGCLSYKLHGLLAESLREQIDFSIENYPIYEQNIKTTTNYTHKNDSIYENVCINSSYCLWGQKMKDVTKGQYIQVWSHLNLATLLNDQKTILYHFRKSVEIGELLPNYPEYQDTLAEAYLEYAYCMSSHFQNNKSAINTYEKAITILEQLPNDNIEYQTHLALAYNDYAKLKQSFLGDIKSAELLFKKTIKISEQVTKYTNDPYAFNTLALGYNNLGWIQLTYYGDYQLAEINFIKALEIGEKIV